MDSLARSDLFFLITSICVVLVTIIGAVVGVYIVMILNDVKHIFRRVKEETDLIAEDINELREDIRQEGKSLRRFIKFLLKVGRRK
jgi:hypothetical protein